MIPALLCLLQLTLAGSAVRVTVSAPAVQVVRGRSALLPCAFHTTAALHRLNVIWTVAPLQQPRHPLQVISYEQGQIVESLSEYMGRVSFAFQPTQDASIFINHSRPADTGTYQCTVINPPDGATPNIGLVGLSVLVPPSSPKCFSEGHSEEGGKIHLRCSVTEGIPAPVFRWERIPADDQMLITRGEDYQGSVTLTNLTSETSGLYRCTVSNQLGSESCAVELYIHVGALGTMGIVAAITITLIMGLVLLVLFALVLCLHQQSRGKRETEETYRAANPSSGQLCVTRSLCGDSSICSRVPAPPTPILYSVRVTADSSPHRMTPDNSTTESEDDYEENASSAPRSSLYSVTSGYLV